MLFGFKSYEKLIRIKDRGSKKAQILGNQIHPNKKPRVPG